MLRRRPFAEGIAGQHYLADNLRRPQIAHQPLGAGVAELAVQRAADLGGNTQRAAVRLRDVDALHLISVGKAKQPFLRAIGRLLVQRDSGPLDDEMIGQHCPHRFRQVGHLVEVGRAAVIKPLPYLTDPEPGDTVWLQDGGKFVPVQADQVPACDGFRREGVNRGHLRLHS